MCVLLFNVEYYSITSAVRSRLCRPFSIISLKHVFSICRQRRCYLEGLEIKHSKRDCVLWNISVRKVLSSCSRGREIVILISTCKTHKNSLFCSLIVKCFKSRLNFLLQSISWMNFCNGGRWVVFCARDWVFVFDLDTGLHVHHMDIPKHSEESYTDCKWFFSYFIFYFICWRIRNRLLLLTPCDIMNKLLLLTLGDLKLQEVVDLN